jgi:tetratricopeptide (TPR) repeat protein
MLNFWRKSQPEPTPQPLRSNAEYKAVLMQVFERLQGDDARIKVKAFFITQKVKADELADWLERVGEGIEVDDVREWVMQLGELGRLNDGKLSRVSGAIAARVSPLSRVEVVEHEGAEKDDRVTAKNILNQQTTAELLELGRQWVRLEQYEFALDAFDRALTLSPESAEIWNEKGVALSKLNRYEEANIAYEKAIVLHGLPLEMSKVSEVKRIEDKHFKVREGSPDEEVEAFFQKGLQQCHSGDYVGAIASFDRALEINPNSHVVWQGRGTALSSLGRYEEALANQEQSLKINSDNYYAWLGRGSLLCDHLGRKEEAITNFERALKINPDGFHAWHNCGIALSGLGRKEEAIISFDQALKIKPDFLSALLNRGIALSALGRKEEAIVNYDQALKIKPDYYEAWNNRGIVLFELGDYEGAVFHFDKALQIEPSNYTAWNNKSGALAKLGRNEEAIVALERVLTIKPDYYEAWNNIGNLLSTLERKEKAIASYDQALKTKPDYYDAWSNRATSLFTLRRYEEVVDSLNQALKIEPDNHSAWFNCGQAQFALGRYKEAIDSYNQTLRINSVFSVAWTSRGLSLSELGCYEEAIASYDQALELNSGCYQSFSSKGVALNQLHRYEEALECAEMSITINSQESHAWYVKGFALGGLDLHEEAIDSYDSSLKLDSRNVSAWEGQGVSLFSLGYYEEACASHDHALEIKPDYHEAWYCRGLCLYMLQRNEEAIASFDKALQIKPDSYSAWVHRGLAAVNSPCCVLVQIIICSKLIPSVVITNSALNQRGWKGLIASHTQGLHHCHKETHLLGHGVLQQCLGNVYHERAKYKSNKDHYYHQAISHYTEALKTLTLETYPEECLKTLQGLIRPLLATGNIPAAKERRIEGLQVLQHLFNANTSAAQKRRIASELVSFSQIAIDILVTEGEPIAALEAAERHKNQRLTWILDEWNEQVLSPSYEQMRSLLKNDAAIVYWHYSEDTLTTFILTLENAAPIVLTQTTKPFSDWKKEWNNQYQDYRQKGKAQSDSKQNHPWRAILKNLNTLSDILNIPAITQSLPSSITQLILIPHRDLHHFPLHALFPSSFAITFLPSLQIGIILQRRLYQPITSSIPLLLIENPKNANPDEGLLYSEVEAAMIRSFFHQAKTLANEKATEIALIQAIPHAQILHFTGHAGFAPMVEVSTQTLRPSRVQLARDTGNAPSIGDLPQESTYNQQSFTPPAKRYRPSPEHSALKLADEEFLTTKTICNLDFNAYFLISLASCETSITGPKNLTVEYVGLNSAFLQAGATAVLGSLWVVEDSVNLWLMVHFYQALLKGQPPAIALQSSQQQFQSLTSNQFISWLTDLGQRLPPHSGVKKILQSEVNGFQKRQETPDRINFRDPYHWAAFTITGRGMP